jgi:hypothetical protein
MLEQILRRLRLAMLFQIGGGGENAPARRTEMARHERRVGDGTGPDGEVDVLRHQILHLFRNADLDLQQRVALQQPGNARNDLHPRHRGG